MLNNIQNTNFKSRIIPSSKLYEERVVVGLVGQNKYISNPWTLRESRFSNDECYTDGMLICSAGFLKAKGGKEFFMFHFNPDDPRNYWGNVKDGLLAAQERLKAGGKKVLQGFLIGGDAEDDESMEQAKNLIKFFKQTGVNFSALLGQKDFPCANLHYSLPKDEVAITFENCAGIKKEKDLKKAFSEVIIGADEFEFMR